MKKTNPFEQQKSTGNELLMLMISPHFVLVIFMISSRGESCRFTNIVTNSRLKIISNNT
jgi:hypothetical protein